MKLPEVEDIKLEVEHQPLTYIKVRANGVLLGLIRKLAKGYTFTSDEIGSFTLPPDTHTDAIPKLVHAFIQEHGERWALFHSDGNYIIECESDYLALLSKAESLIDKSSLTSNEEEELSKMTDAIAEYEEVNYPF